MSGGDLGMWDGHLSALAFHLKAYIFNVEYRLSPEHKHPDALNDCYRATYYIIKLA